MLTKTNYRSVGYPMCTETLRASQIMEIKVERISTTLVVHRLRKMPAELIQKIKDADNFNIGYLALLTIEFYFAGYENGTLSGATLRR